MQSPIMLRDVSLSIWWQPENPGRPLARASGIEAKDNYSIASIVGRVVVSPKLLLWPKIHEIDRGTGESRTVV